MYVEQAVFTSAQTGGMQGYHLVARSPGIHEPLAQELVRWGPSHGAMLNSHKHAACLNFHPAGPEHVCLSRTICGGPEYSRRGGLKLVTRMVVLSADQLAGFGYNPLVLARTLLALGCLRFEPRIPPTLSVLEVPASTVASDAATERADGTRTRLLADLASLVQQQRPTAVIGDAPAQELLELLFAKFEPAERLRLSFTTGLKPSVNRSFRLHFLPGETDAATRQQLESRGVACLVLNREPVRRTQPAFY